MLVGGRKSMRKGCWSDGCEGGGASVRDVKEEGLLE